MGRNRGRAMAAAVAAVAATAAVGASAVSAETTSHATRIHLVGDAGSGANPVVGGVLETNKDCLRLRKVIMYKDTGSGWERVDQILSSAHGAWGFRYHSDDPTQVKFTVTRETRDGVVCEEDDRLATLSASPRAGTRASATRPNRDTTSYSTGIGWQASVIDDTATYWIQIGQLHTPEVCQGLRKVIVYVKRGRGGRYKRTDTVLSSPQGVWAFYVERTENAASEDVRWVVTPDTRRNGSIVCKGSEVEQSA